MKFYITAKSCPEPRPFLEKYRPVLESNGFHIHTDRLKNKTVYYICGSTNNLLKLIELTDCPIQLEKKQAGQYELYHITICDE